MAPRTALAHIGRGIAALDADAVSKLHLEDVALCVLWLEQHQSNPSQEPICQAIRGHIKHWLQHHRRPDTRSEGRRQQPILRRAIDTLESRGAQEMAKRDLNLLSAVRQLVERAQAAGEYAYLRGRLSTHGEAIERARRSPVRDDEPPSVVDSFDVLTDHFISHCPIRVISSLGGIAMRLQGPLYETRRNIKVLGNVPDECTLISEMGSIWVTGYLLGNATSEHACEVHENIAGNVVARQGDVRARTLLKGSMAVSKGRGVFVFSAQQPRNVFGGAIISVKQDAAGGRYAAPRIRVGGSILGGEFHAADSINASRFDLGEMGLSLVLRTELTGEDYGVPAGKQALRLLSDAARVRARIRHFEQMAEMTVNEAHETAASGIIFLLSDNKVRRLVEELQRIDRRTHMLNRIISGLHLMALSAEEQMRLTGSHRKTSYATPRASLTNEVRIELNVLEDEQRTDEDLRRERDVLLSISESLSASGSDSYAAHEALNGIQQRLEGWLSERERLGAQYTGLQAKLRAAVGRPELFGPSAETLSPMRLFQEFLMQVRNDPSDTAMAARAQSPFMEHLLNSIQVLADRKQLHETRATEQGVDLKNTCEALFVDYRIETPEIQIQSYGPARASGAFAAGVRLFASPDLLDKSEFPPGMMLVTRGESDGCTFVRREDGCIERGDESIAATTQIASAQAPAVVPT